jgi:hypothetical protein
MRNTEPPIVMEEISDCGEVARARARREKFQRNWAWFEAHGTDIYSAHRGKCICVAAGELFVADSPAEVISMATAAHPDDDGRFTRYIPREKMTRIYAARRSLAPL